jgi:hypothetical protein
MGEKSRDAGMGVVRFDVPVTVGGLTFTFPVCTRPLALGADLTIQYHWVDLRQVRAAGARRGDGTTLFGDIVGHWWTAITGGTNAADVDDVGALLLALTYGQVAADKSLQRVFADAHLGPRAGDPATVGLDPHAGERIRRTVAARDPLGVRAELFRLLGPAPLDGGLAAAVEADIAAVLDRGVALVRDAGWDGMRYFLDALEAWGRLVRRRGGNPFRRTVLNHLSYLAKASFHLAYANLWVSLLPQLKAEHGLDPVSERFLRVWHFQNQPGLRADGTVAPDAFCGQVLALHPLSGVLMRDPALCAAVGPFFARSDHDDLFRDGSVAGCNDYWRMVEAVLLAATVYERARAAQPPARGKHGRKACPRPGRWASGGQSVATAEALDLAGLATAAGWACTHCGGDLVMTRGPTDVNDGAGRVEFRFSCRQCGAEDVRRVSRDELAEVLGVAE